MLWLVILHRELGNAVFMMLRVDGLQRERNTMHRFNNKEEQSIPPPPPPPRIVMLPPRFGAIAVSHSTFASTYNMSSAKEARQKALQDCQYGKKQPCRIFTEYRNSCVSLAQGRDKRSGYLVAEFADNRGGEAARKAMDKCSAQYGNCSIIIEEECSIPEPPR